MSKIALCNPPASQASSEVENFTERKNLHPSLVSKNIFFGGGCMFF